MAEDRVARKLTTILAADVAGYSRLMRADEEATLETLGAHREILERLIARHDGRVFNTGGDSLLAEFGSAVEAVRCAVSCQEELRSRNAELPEERRLRFRIGVNIGDVMVRNGDLFGDGVNVAARIEGLAEPGGVCISGSVFEQVRHKLSLDVEDMGPQRVKNIAEPVAAYRLAPGVDPGAAGAATAVRRVGGRRWAVPAMAAAVLAILAAGGLALWQPWLPAVEPASAERMAYPLPDTPSIAVLPFVNISDDAGQEYFADGITEDLITDLSKVSDLFVIARNSVFTYKGQAMKVRQVAEELGVRYVLEGSVRRAGEQVRINAQLIDATTGGHVWAERYDGSLADVFALQDKVTSRIVSALELTLAGAASAERIARETDQPLAYDAFLKGWEHYRLDTPEHYAKALEYFRRAADLDPGYDRAWAAMASIHWKSYRQEWSPVLGLDISEARRKALELIAKARGRPTALAYQVESQMAIWRGRYAEAIAVAEQALALEPNDAESQVVLAETLIYGGEADRAQFLIESARRHDPHNEARYAFLQGLAEFGKDEFEAAAAAFRRALELNPELWNPEGRLGRTYCRPCIALIAAYGHLGQTDAATTLIEKVRKTWVGFSIASEHYLWPYKTNADMNRFADGLRKAGVAEF